MHVAMASKSEFVLSSSDSRSSTPTSVIASLKSAISFLLLNIHVAMDSKSIFFLSPLLRRSLSGTFSFSSLSSLAVDTDYHDGGDAGDTAVNGDDSLDDDVGVAVEFEENGEEQEESDLDMVPEDEEEDDDVTEVDGSGAMQMGGIDDEEEHEAMEGMALNVQDIDAYWLQRMISQAYDHNIYPPCKG